MNEVSRPTKDRSPNFPYIPLSTALERAEQYYAGEKRSAAPYAVAVRHWNLTPSSSAALQTVGALKSYGLMSDEGSGATRKVRLTDLAFRILLDQRPDSQERKEFMRQAANLPAVAAQVYGNWPDELPSPANLVHHLVFDLKFNATTAPKAASILIKNHELTGMSESYSSSDEDEAGGDMQLPARMPSMNTTAQIEAAARVVRAPTAQPAIPFWEASGEEIANIRVSRSCTIRLLASGPYNKQSIESLVKQLELGLELGNFDEDGIDESGIP